MPNIAERYQRVKEQIVEESIRCHRDPNEVALLAVSKTKPSADIVALYNKGQRAFGENYLQEAVSKIREINIDDIEWHFIGHIQSNKTKEIAENFHWAHGLESLKHAKRLNDQRLEKLPPLQVCIQVNITGEESKSGVSVEQLDALAQQITDLPNLTLRGLMTMPNPNTSNLEQKAVFQQLRQCKEHLLTRGVTLDTLSMGMSGDMGNAICEGSTMVRIGTALFGSRN